MESSKENRVHRRTSASRVEGGGGVVKPQLAKGDATAMSLVEAVAEAQKQGDHPATVQAWVRVLQHIDTHTQLYSQAQLQAFHQIAVDRLPKDELRKDPDYARIWIGLAKAQAMVDPNEARTTFKYMKIERIGLDCAHLYREWSDLERSMGNLAKSNSIIEQGRKRHAKPASMLESAVVPETFEDTVGSGNYSDSGVVVFNHQSHDANNTQDTAMLVEDDTEVITKTLPLTQIQSHTNPRHQPKPRPQSQTVIQPQVTPLRPRSRHSEDSYGFRNLPSSAAAPPPCAPRPGYGSVSGSNSGSILRKPVSVITPASSRPSASTPAPTTHSNTGGIVGGGEAFETPRAKRAVDFGTDTLTEAAVPRAAVRTPGTATRKYHWAQMSPSPEKEQPRRSSAKVRFSVPEKPAPPSTILSKTLPATRYRKPKLESSTAVFHGSSSQSEDNSVARPGPVKPEYATAPMSSAAAEPVQPVASTPSSVSRANSETVKKTGQHRTVTINGVGYLELEMVGKGGSGKVYKTVGPDLKIYAIKRVKIDPLDTKSTEDIRNEITLLKKLRGKPTIVELFDSQEDQEHIWMVFEFGETDLARLFRSQEGKPIGINYLRTYWQQMLEAVHTIHEERIVHSDLKPANFLIVGGRLKLIDFGIAKAIASDTTHIVRNSQIGTLNYMSPEAILGADNGLSDDTDDASSYKLGRASDIWSLGCILYAMAVGRTPFQHLSFVKKLAAITDPKHEIAFPSTDEVNADLLDVLKLCLRRNPRERPTIPELLKHPLLCRAAPDDSHRPSISRSQVESLLTQLAKAGLSYDKTANSLEIVDTIHRQLQSGQNINLDSLIQSKEQPNLSTTL